MRRAADVLVGMGMVVYLIGVAAILLGAPPEVKYPPMALASSAWLAAWAFRSMADRAVR